jgi:hypothetical protein
MTTQNLKKQAKELAININSVRKCKTGFLVTYNIQISESSVSETKERFFDCKKSEILELF